MRRKTILLLIAFIPILVALPIEFSQPGKPSARPSSLWSGFGGRWVVEGGVVAEDFERATGENKITYATEDGMVRFSQSIEDFSAVKFVSNSKYIYGLLYRKAENKYPRGYYKVIRCGYGGVCRYDNLFVEGVFDISAAETGYYVITYRFEDFYFADVFSAPRRAEIFHLTDLTMTRVCCQADINPYSVTYSPAMGVSFSAIVGKKENPLKFSILHLANGNISKIFEESMEPPPTIWDRKNFDTFNYCVRHHIYNTNIICIYNYVDLSRGQIYDMHVLDGSFHAVGHLNSFAFPKLVEGRGVVYMNENGKLATLDTAKLSQ